MAGRDRGMARCAPLARAGPPQTVSRSRYSVQVLGAHGQWGSCREQQGFSRSARDPAALPCGAAGWGESGAGQGGAGPPGGGDMAHGPQPRGPFRERLRGQGRGAV